MAPAVNGTGPTFVEIKFEAPKVSLYEPETSVTCHIREEKKAYSPATKPAGRDSKAEE